MCPSEPTLSERGDTDLSSRHTGSWAPRSESARRAEVLARLEDSSEWLVDRQTREYEQGGEE